MTVNADFKLVGRGMCAIHKRTKRKYAEIASLKRNLYEFGWYSSKSGSQVVRMGSHVPFRQENDSRIYSAVWENGVQCGGAVNTREMHKCFTFSSACAFLTFASASQLLISTRTADEMFGRHPSEGIHLCHTWKLRINSTPGVQTSYSEVVTPR